MHCARRICIVSFTYTSGEQISTASIYLNSWAPYIYIRLAFIYVCIVHMGIFLLSVCTERWCSELLLLDAEPLPPARVHCIIQFWSLAIKKRNKGRTIVLAHRHMDRGRETRTHNILLTRNFSMYCSYSIDACVSAMIHPHKVSLAIFFKRCVYLW